MANQDQKLVTDFALRPMAEKGFPSFPKFSVLLIKDAITPAEFLGPKPGDQNKTLSPLLFVE